MIAGGFGFWANVKTMDAAAESFIRAARAYCALIENYGSSNTWMYTRECLVSVLDLYRAALLLPETEPDSVKLQTPIDHSVWDASRKRLAGRFSRDFYWEIYEPFEHEQPKPIYGSLSDDLADIWRDIKPCLIVIG